jgi:hypothetical protein
LVLANMKCTNLVHFLRLGLPIACGNLFFIESERGISTLIRIKNLRVGTTLAKGKVALQFFACLPTFLYLIGVLLC